MSFSERVRLFFEVLRARLHPARLPGVGPRDLVLDLGSGGAPNFRANVLCDRFVSDDTDRLGTPLAHPAGRPFIIGDAHYLPFADDSFDYVFCSHLLEHVADPAAVLGELQRVARGGYIETPSRAAEKMHSLPIHKWLVGVEESKLVFEGKPRPILDPELVEWFQKQMAENPDFRPLWMKQWQAGLVTQIHWQDRIDFEVRGQPAQGPFEESQEGMDAEAPVPAQGLISRVDATYGRWLRRHSQHRARDLTALLACPVPDCRGSLAANGTALRCSRCRRSYPVRDGAPVLLPEAADG